MKKISLIVPVLLFTLGSLAQKVAVSWGDEFKLKQSLANDMQLFADNSGLYLTDRHDPSFEYFIFGPSKNDVANIIKIDTAFNEVYRVKIKKELKFKEFEDCIFLKEKLFLLATAYDYKTYLVTLYAIEINKADGEVKGDWKAIADWKKDEFYKDFKLKINYAPDSSGIIVVARLGGKSKSRFALHAVDAEMNVRAKAIIENEFDPKEFIPEQVLYTSKGNFLVSGRHGDRENKRNKGKLEFRDYYFRMYNGNGEMIKNIIAGDDAKWVYSARLEETPSKEIALVGFFSQDKKSAGVDGMLVNIIDGGTGEVKNTAYKYFEEGMLNTDEDYDVIRKINFVQRSVSRQERERVAGDNGFLKFVRFHKFIFTADNQLLVFAEKYRNYSYSITTGVGMYAQTLYYGMHECGDIILANINFSGSFNWINTIQKKQLENAYESETNKKFDFSIGKNYFDNNVRSTVYAGFDKIYSKENGQVLLFLNDKRTQEENPKKAGKPLTEFEESDCYIYHLNIVTGNWTKEKLFSNKPELTLNIGSGMANGADFFFRSSTSNPFIGRQGFVVGKITVQ